MNPFLAASAPADLLDIFSSYDGAVLFRGLTEATAGQAPLLGRIGWIFTGAGAVFLLWGFMLRSSSGGEEKAAHIVRTVLVLAGMLAGPTAMTAVLQAADSLYDAQAGSPSAIATACVKAAYAMPELGSLFDVLRREALSGGPAPDPAAAGRASLIDQTNDGSVLGYVEAFGVAVWDTAAEDAAKAGQTWSGLARLLSLATGLGAAMLKCLLVAMSLVPLYFLLLGAACVAWFMEQVRFFLAVCGTAALPLFIGMFSMPAASANRQAAQRYVLNLVSVGLWPVSWAIGHTATVALYNALISLVAGTSRVADLATALQWEGLVSSGPTAAQLRAGEEALGNWFMGNLASLLSILVGGIGFTVWVFAVTILGPVFLHRMLSAGSLYIAEAARATAVHSLKAARMGAGVGQALAGGSPGWPRTAEAGGRLSAAPALPVTVSSMSGAADLGTSLLGEATLGGAARLVEESLGKGGAHM